MIVILLRHNTFIYTMTCLLPTPYCNIIYLDQVYSAFRYLIRLLLPLRGNIMFFFKCRSSTKIADKNNVGKKNHNKVPSLRCARNKTNGPAPLASSLATRAMSRRHPATEAQNPPNNKYRRPTSNNKR